MAYFADTVPAGMDFWCPPIRHTLLSSKRAALPPSEEEQELMAASIDARVTELESEGYRDVALLSLMVDHALLYQRLMHGAPPERRHQLFGRYVGLIKFNALLARTRATVPGILPGISPGMTPR